MPANVNDTVPADGLICGDEHGIRADIAYHTHEREQRLKAAGVGCGLMRRVNRHHPRLMPAARRFYRAIARRRRRRDHLRHAQAAHGARHNPLCRAGQVLMATMAFNMRRWVTLTA